MSDSDNPGVVLKPTPVTFRGGNQSGALMAKACSFESIGVSMISEQQEREIYSKEPIRVLISACLLPSLWHEELEALRLFVSFVSWPSGGDNFG